MSDEQDDRRIITREGIPPLRVGDIVLVPFSDDRVAFNQKAMDSP